MNGTNEEGLSEQLSSLFGGYRAEWLGESLFELFTAPDYLPELLTARPCFLIGGRGTGKTTVLRGLSYAGQSALNESNPRQWNYFGMYHRVNTNRVRAFEGPELSDEQWVRAFSHYVNLSLIEEVFAFLKWYSIVTDREDSFLPPDLELLAVSMHAPASAARSLAAMAAEVRLARVRFESSINNVADGLPGDLTLLGQPIDLLCSALHQMDDFAGKQFFFLLDEYENYSDYQQQVLNTLIKHSGDLYTFKIGMKNLGLRQRSTLNPSELLQSPADYQPIDVTSRLTDHDFAAFAGKICNERLSRINPSNEVVGGVADLLPGLTETAEAELLGIGGALRDLRTELRDTATDEALRHFDEMPPLAAYMVGFWARSQGESASNMLDEAIRDSAAWRERLANYQHAMLFTIRRRKRGIHKYYSGWDTFTRLADGNIRYLLQLVFEALMLQVHDSGDLSTPIDPATQTRAAQEVGRKNLTELEGLAVNGAQVTRLVLGLGRVFEVMARQAEGHAPEVNQFVVTHDSADRTSDRAEPATSEQVEELLTAAVMHLALIRAAANKLPSSSGDTKEYDYSLHPIYAAFFEFSHRRKRRMVLSYADIDGIVRTPRSTINGILSRSARTITEEIPEQLALFAPYFDAK